MKKNVYTFLLLVTLSSLFYTGYYVFTHQSLDIPPPLATATSTEEFEITSESIPSKNILTTQSGKKISINETNPAGQSLSTITITPSGFATNTQIILEKNKLTDFLLADLNGDTFDELILITTAQGQGSYGEATIFTTQGDKELLQISIPTVTENDSKVGGIFEGYAGHDKFTVINGLLLREFPLYTATDTNSTPTTGMTRKVVYSLVEKDNDYSVIFLKATTSATTVSTAGGNATTTKNATTTPKIP